MSTMAKSGASRGPSDETCAGADQSHHAESRPGEQACHALAEQEVIVVGQHHMPPARNGPGPSRFGRSGTSMVIPAVISAKPRRRAHREAGVGTFMGRVGDRCVRRRV